MPDTPRRPRRPRPPLSADRVAQLIAQIEEKLARRGNLLTPQAYTRLARQLRALKSQRAEAAFKARQIPLL
jgi:hypothetical protein